MSTSVEDPIFGRTSLEVKRSRYNPVVRRLARSLPNALIILTLTFYVGMIAMWERSYRWVDSATFGGRVEWTSENGRITVSNLPVLRAYEDQFAMQASIDSGGSGLLLGNSAPPPPVPPAPQLIELKVPYWAVFAFATPGLAWIVVRRTRRSAPGLCSICGYDLRATPERCPECGTVPGIT